jgi:hypothetical protein
VSAVLGIYVHLQQRRYRVVWALVDGAQLLQHGEMKAPTDSEDQCLVELDTRVRDLLERLAATPSPPTTLALRLHDVRRMAGGMRDDEIRIPAHAEGVILAVAARRRLGVMSLSGQKLGGAKGIARKTSGFSLPAGDPDLAQAVAAAREASSSP